MTRVAPHLVRPLPLLLAVERRARGEREARAALGLYGGIAASRHALPRLVRPGRARSSCRRSIRRRSRLCGLVPEAQTHDARLTLATVRGAAAAGATTLNTCGSSSGATRAAGWRERGCTTSTAARELAVGCRAAVNATGPWVDSVRSLDRRGAPSIARLSKGVHAVLPQDSQWAAGVALFDEQRTAFAVPWQGMLLVGASDTEYDGDPATSVRAVPTWPPCSRRSGPSSRSTPRGS